MAEERTKPDLAARVRDIMEAAEREDLDGVLRYFSADALCESRLGNSGPEAAWWGSPGNARANWEAYIKGTMAAPEHEWKIKQIGDRIVLVVSRHFVRLDRGTLGTEEATVYEWENDLVTRVSQYGQDIAEAREVAHRLGESS